MKCMKCGMPATTFVTTTINGNTTQQYLCDECYREQQHSFYFKTRQSQPAQKDIVCPKCNTKQSQFLKTGFLGCPHCYKAFQGTIDKLLPKIQGKTTHVARQHMGAEPQESRAETLKKLNAQLYKAKMAMNYEEASKIFEKIKELDPK
ncbi:MAG: hypothetical protein IJV77_02425 [Clostridia bacterium]|nr:hypothetical protein [Clostridia bacterium]